MTRAPVAPSLLALAALATLAAPALAQSPAAPASAPALADARWGAYLGCWRAVDDPAGTGTRICVAPAAQGVTLTTIVGRQKVSEETRVADGVAHRVASEGCGGSETIRWSDNGHRLYRAATIACDGGAPRTLAAASFFVRGPTWIDIETVEAGGTTSVRVSRLVRSGYQELPDGTPVVAPPGVRGPSLEALAGFTVPDVIDLSRALPADGVQAALLEAPARYRLNARALIAMDDAGVGDRVIDLMVGLTYPQRFEVSRVTAGGWRGGGPGFSAMADPFYAPWVGPAALFNCYSNYGWAAANYWGSCAGYGALAYAMFPGYYSGYWGPYGPGWVVTQPGQGGTAAPGDPPVEGRLVNGRGYTQVRPVDTTFVLGGGRNSGLDTGQTLAGGTTNGGSVSGTGYSGGTSGGGGSERTAVPRGPGGAR